LETLGAVQTRRRFPVTTIPPQPDIETLPKVVKSRDWDLFVKECRIAGWDLLKLNRNKKVIIIEDWACLYRRTKKLWIRGGWVGIRESRQGFTVAKLPKLVRYNELLFFDSIDGVGKTFKGIEFGGK
jgi:hypothetical protein